MFTFSCFGCGWEFLGFRNVIQAQSLASPSMLVLVVFIQKQKIGKTLSTLSAATSSTGDLSAFLAELPTPGNLTVRLVKVTHSASKAARNRLFSQKLLEQRKETSLRVNKDFIK